MTPTVDITLRPMCPDDIQAGMRLKTIAGWNQTAQDWRLYLALNPAGCFVAAHRDQVVGTVVCVNYADLVSWIGMVLVDPEFRRRGIATQLTKQALASLSTCETIKLDATPTGQKVYHPLGFAGEYSLYRMTIAAVPNLGASNSLILPLGDEDMSEIAGLDTPAFGADRMAVIQSLLILKQSIAWKLIRAGKIQGYCLGRPGANFYHLGPIVAATPVDALELTKTALSGLAGQAIVIDVPLIQSTLLGWLTAIGFTRQRPFLRMVYGPNQHPGTPEQIFASSGPELG